VTASVVVSIERPTEAEAEVVAAALVVVSIESVVAEWELTPMAEGGSSPVQGECRVYGPESASKRSIRLTGAALTGVSGDPFFDAIQYVLD
jgi:hypothetical protein